MENEIVSKDGAETNQQPSESLEQHTQNVNVVPEDTQNSISKETDTPTLEELKAREDALNLKERDISVKELIAKNNLPQDIFNSLDGFDLDQSKKILSTFQKYAKDLSIDIADKRFKEKGFSVNNTTPAQSKSYGEMNIRERIALKNTNPELYSDLLAAYRNNK